MPSKVSVLMENPAACMIANVPMIDTGIAITGISVVRHSRRNANTTSTTSTKAMKMVSVTSSSERRTYSVLSNATSTLMSSRHLALRICSSRATQRVDDLDLVRARLLLEIQPGDRRIAHLQRAALVRRAELHVADVAEAHHAVGGALDDEVR